MVAADVESVAQRRPLFRGKRRRLRRLAVRDGVGAEMDPAVDLDPPDVAELRPDRWLGVGVEHAGAGAPDQRLTGRCIRR